MKVLAAWIAVFVAVSFSPFQAQAGSGDVAAGALIAIGLTGGAVAVSGNAYQGFLPNELKDWKDPATDTSIQLADQCDVAGEFRIGGTGLYNFLYFALKNHSAKPVSLKPDEIRMIFESGKERLPAYVGAVQTVEIKAGWRVIGVAPFPEKKDFKDQNRISVVIPFYGEQGKAPCTFSVDLQRPAGVPADSGSYQERTSLEVGFELGPTLPRSTNLAQLGSPSVGFAATMYGYGSVHHGMWLGFQIDGFGGGNATTLAPLTGGLSNPGFFTGAFSLGYSYRLPLSESLKLSIDVAPSAFDYSYSTAGSSSNDTFTFAVHTKVNLDWRFWKSRKSLFWFGDHTIGISFTDFWIPSQALAAITASGFEPSLLIRYKIGM